MHLQNKTSDSIALVLFSLIPLILLYFLGFFALILGQFNVISAIKSLLSLLFEKVVFEPRSA